LNAQTNQLAICDFGQSIQSPDFHSHINVRADKDRWEVRGVKDPVTTLSYRPPELLMGSDVCTTAGDMWAVACVLVEMLTGRLLFAPMAVSPQQAVPTHDFLKPFRFDPPPHPKTPEEQVLSQIVGFLGARASSASLPSRNPFSKSFLMAGLAGLCSLSRGGAMEEDELLLNFFVWFARIRSPISSQCQRGSSAPLAYNGFSRLNKGHTLQFVF